MNDRKSEIELLRIIVMILIIVTHCIVWGTLKTNNASSSQQLIGTLANDLIKWHVNVFIIITGFFGIKKILNVSKVIIMSIFYTWIMYALQCILCDTAFSFLPIIKSLFFITHTKYRFIQTYILLFLLAPFFNELIKKETYPLLAGSFLFIDCWCGYIHNETISNGFGIIHFITMYIIGKGLKIYNITINKETLIIAFCLISCFLSIQSLFYKDLTSGHGYNNPLLIINAIIIFLLFKRLNIQNRKINQLASSCLAVYLIHDSDLGHLYILKTISIINSCVANPINYILTIISLSICIYIIGALLDKIMALIYTPIIYNTISILKNKFSNKYDL